MATLEAKVSTGGGGTSKTATTSSSASKKGATTTVTATSSTSKQTSSTTTKTTSKPKETSKSTAKPAAAAKKGENPADFLPSTTEIDSLQTKFSQLTREEIIAHAYDFNKTAKKTKGSIRNSKFLKFLGVKDSFLKLLPNAVDLNHDKQIDLREYIKFVSQVKKSTDRELFELLFRMFDKNNDDKITKSEFKNGFKKMRKANYLSKEAEGHLNTHVLNTKFKKETILSRSQFVDACLELVPKPKETAAAQPTTSSSSIK